MTIKGLLKTSGLAALATAMAVTALPSAASAQNGGWGEKRSQERADRGDRGNRGDRGDRGGNWGGGRNDSNRGEARAAPRVEPSTPAPRAAPQRSSAPAPRAEWSGGNRGNANPRVENRGRDNDRQRQAEYRGSGRQGNDDRRANTSRKSDYPSAYAARRAGEANSRGYNDRRDDNRAKGWDGNRNDRDRDRGKGWSGGKRGDSHYNGGRHDSKKWDGKRWDRKWRNSSRYNWSHYRNSNRNIFRIGTYYSPYRNYYYRPLSVGFFLDSLFYSNRYWINDPYQYRLPEVYGPYRWVRYYDDVLLVDIYSGEVVDVIRNFFW